MSHSGTDATPERLRGQLALVTGAGRGIGAAIASRLAAEGATVLVNDLRPGNCDATVAAIEAAGGQARGLAGDVAQPADAQRMLDEVAERDGRLDVLVNNAGVARDAPAHTMSDEDWRLVQEVALWGSFHMCRAALPLLRGARDAPPEHLRKVVNVSSSVGLYGAIGTVNYAAAKAGVIGLTKTLAREWARHGINVNAVAPGLILDTGMAAEKPAELIERVRAQIPLGRAGRGWDVAAGVAFLSSADADYVTGQVLELHGGLEIPV
ncbi:MAG: SDR family NAD(P)-dependent oxidoreductase [Solirubrobacteraceae bacterium]